MRQGRNIIGVYILEILGKCANKDHPMTQVKLLEKLAEYPYEVERARNTLSAYLNIMCAEERIIKTDRGYYMPGTFDDHELRLLIDGVLFGQHIPTELAESLIRKLKGMSELGLKDRIRNVHYLPNIPRTENNKLYEIIDLIDEAIQTKRKIRVTRCKYNTDKELVPIEGEYILDPYYLVTDKSRYYLICRRMKDGVVKDDLENLRIDRFRDVKILKDTPADDIRTIEKYRNGFSLDEYKREHLYMVSGKTVVVKMEVLEKRIGDFIDWYGKNFTVLKKQDGIVTIRFTVNDNALIFWALQYGDAVRILSPAEVVEVMREKVRMLGEKYSFNSEKE